MEYSIKMSSILHTTSIKKKNRHFKSYVNGKSEMLCKFQQYTNIIGYTIECKITMCHTHYTNALYNM